MSKDDIKLQIFENKLKQDLEKRTALVIQQTIKKLKRDENDYKDARVYKWRSMSFNFTTNNFQYSPAANFFGQKTQTHKILHKKKKTRRGRKWSRTKTSTETTNMDSQSTRADGDQPI